MNEPREWIFHPLSTWPVLCNGGGLFRWQVGHISVAYFSFSRHQYLFLFLFYRIVLIWFSYSVSVWSLGQHVCCFSPAITHLSSFWCFGNLQNHPVSLKIYASLLIANSKSVLNIKSRRRPTSLYLKRRPYKVIFGGIRAKHSASSLKDFHLQFLFILQRLTFMTRHQFFPPCLPFVNTVYRHFKYICTSPKRMYTNTHKPLECLLTSLYTIHLVALENSWHFAMPPTVSLQNDIWETTLEIP